MFYVLFALVLLISTATGFLYDDCPAPAPCTCTYNAIKCGHRHLGRVPVFHNTSLTMRRPWNLQLNGNSISLLQDNEFLELKPFSNGQNISIYLGGNSIRVDSFGDAFNGLENNVTLLNLDDNDLTSLPYAIGHLKHLETLSLLDNPLTTIDLSVLLSIRHTLTDLSIPLQNLAAWPDAIQYLTKLQRLEIKSFSHDIPVEAFKGFRTTLVKLYLEDLNFTVVPSAVCDLHSLEYLHVGMNGKLSGKNLISCNPALGSLSTLKLVNNRRMSTFPNVFNTFPNLDSIEIVVSDVSFVDDFVVPNNTKISIFEISASKLATVPGAVNKLPLLHDLYLEGNLIHSIEMHSVINLPYLTNMFLNGNPIVFISGDAFRNVPNLSHLELENTKLTTIPLLVETLPDLRSIYFAGSPFKCTCEFPRFASKLTIDGLCHVTHEYISDFISQCP